MEQVGELGVGDGPAGELVGHQLRIVVEDGADRAHRCLIVVSQAAGPHTSDLRERETLVTTCHFDGQRDADRPKIHAISLGVVWRHTAGS
ncbi:hypothetical protein GCM10022215_04120 [Nocardioides fonticola]|uniref:Uncharacterized protein n=1 Tax=Nocardioides fonticola TaxID=450363 RepID=A0ABP7XBC9_9ACTN